MNIQLRRATLNPHPNPHTDSNLRDRTELDSVHGRLVRDQQEALTCVGHRMRPLWPGPRAHLPIGRGWPTLKAALRLIWRWRGALEGEVAEACGQLLSTQRVAVAAARIARRLEDVVVTRNVDARGSTAGRGWTEPCTRPRQTSATAVGLRMMRGRSIPQVAAEDARM